MFGVLTVVHLALGNLKDDAASLYLAVMSVIGVLSYAAAFLFIPITALETEAARWRQKLIGGISLIKAFLP